jgi:hypothetical protein
MSDSAANAAIAFIFSSLGLISFAVINYFQQGELVLYPIDYTFTLIIFIMITISLSRGCD